MTRDAELHGRLVSLAERILEGTSTGTVRWSTTDDEQRFVVSGSQSSVMIESFTDREGDMVCTFSILNNRGSTVDSLVSDWEGVDDQGHAIGSPWNKTLNDLYHAARRSAYNVDEIIKSIVTDLDNGSLRNPPRAKKIEDPWAQADEPPF